MSSKGDKVCPLCTEEMDLTDQQLKPCKCGYEICVWCWNHILEMAERDNTEGRCPACRTPYDKEKIVGMAADCERIVAEITSERKQKSQKSKPKSIEGRMHLSNVRVIQRHLVYIIGLPLNLADESLLQRKEYFGQYGKVLKVSISRTATGAIQHSVNNSCCVYITYSKEEDAIRCIQSVHSFVLEGRPLRACFGTTKYCHAWLKNMPCNIPDCLYLHDFGSQEDSFTKDDLVSAFTRSRVQQTIGATNNLHRRSGDVLPPPADECTDRNILSTVNLDSKASSNNIGKWDGVSGVDNGDGRPNALPGAASWVMRVSASMPPVTGSSQPGGTLNLKSESSNGSQALRSDAVGMKGSSDMKRMMLAGGSYKVHPPSLTPNEHSSFPPTSHEIAGDSTSPSACTSPFKTAKAPHVTDLELKNFQEDGDFQGLCSQLSSISIGNHLQDKFFDSSFPVSSTSNSDLRGSQDVEQDVRYSFSEPSGSPSPRESVNVEEDVLGFDSQKLKGFDSHLAIRQHLKQSTNSSSQQVEVNHQKPVDAYSSISPITYNEGSFPLASSNPVSSNGFCKKQAKCLTELDNNSNYSGVTSAVRLGKYLEDPISTVASSDNKVGVDAGESSIISNILSMDFDEWEDPLTSPQSLVKLLAENDTRHGSLRIPSLRKALDSSQSRFSFARQDDIFYQVPDLEHSPVPNKFSVSQNFIEKKDIHMDKYHDISSNGSSMESNGFLAHHPFTPSAFSVTGSKTSTSPPLGFSVPSRAVPPGFTTHGTMHYDFHQSANNLRENPSSRPRSVGISGNAEYIEPWRMKISDSIFSPRLSNTAFDLSPQNGRFDYDMELQRLMQPSITAQQSPRFPDFRNRFSPPNDAYGISPMHLGQSPPNKPRVAQGAPQQLRNLHASNGHWGGWNKLDNASDLGVPEILTNGGLGYNKFLPSYEDLKFRVSSSSHLYNRGFAM